MDRYVSTREAADRLGVSVKSVRRYAAEGAITAYRIRGSNQLRFRASEVESMIEEVEVA